jgi:hypothetical protein
MRSSLFLIETSWSTKDSLHQVNSLIMAAEYGHETFWDPALLTPQTTGSIPFDGDFAISPLDPTISV